jgi:hypothetical protein
MRFANVSKLEAAESERRRAAAHIAAAKGVLAAGIEGDGSDAGDALIEKLKNAQAQLQNSAS